MEAPGLTILDDTYNASPPAVLAALQVLASLPGRPIAVLGEMLELGDAHAASHRAVGEVAGAFGRFSDYPNIKGWVDRFQARPAYRAALEKSARESKRKRDEDLRRIVEAIMQTAPMQWAQKQMEGEQGEGGERTHLDIPAVQEHLLRALRSAESM